MCKSAQKEECMKKKNVNKLLALGLVSAMTAGMLAG